MKRITESQSRNPVISHTRKPLRLALEDHVVGEILPEATLERLERFCDEQHQEPTAAIAAAVENWLSGKSSSQKEVVEASAPHKPSSVAASTFYDLYTKARESCYDDGVTMLEGLMGLIEGNPAFTEEFYALSLIATGDHLLNHAPAVEQELKLHHSAPGQEFDEAYYPTLPVDVVRLGIERANRIGKASKAAAV